MGYRNHNSSRLLNGFIFVRRHRDWADSMLKKCWIPDLVDRFPEFICLIQNCAGPALGERGIQHSIALVRNHVIACWFEFDLVNPSRTSFVPKCYEVRLLQVSRFCVFFQQLDTSILQTYCKHSSFTDSGTVKSAWNHHSVLFPQETFFYSRGCCECQIG